MINIIKQLILDLGGVEYQKVDNIIMPDYLFKLPNNIWLSINYDEKSKKYMEIHIGSLYTFNDKIPNIVVLQELDVYTNIINLLQFNDRSQSVYNNISTPEEIVNYLQKNFKLILDNYEFFSKFHQYKENEKSKLKCYKNKNIKNISDCKKIEDEVSIPKNNVQVKVKQRKYKHKQINNALGEGLAEILFYIVGGIIGALFLSLFSFGDKLLEKFDLELIIVIGMFVISIPIGIVIIILMYIHRQDVPDGIQLHPLYYKDDSVVSEEYFVKQFNFLIENGYILKIKKNKYQTIYKFKKEKIKIEVVVVQNVINCYIKLPDKNQISLLHCEYVDDNFDIKYYQSSNIERIELIVNTILNNKSIFDIKDNI